MHVGSTKHACSSFRSTPAPPLRWWRTMVCIQYAHIHSLTCRPEPSAPAPRPPPPPPPCRLLPARCTTRSSSRPPRASAHVHTVSHPHPHRPYIRTDPTSTSTSTPILHRLFRCRCDGLIGIFWLQFLCPNNVITSGITEDCVAKQTAATRIHHSNMELERHQQDA